MGNQNAMHQEVVSEQESSRRDYLLHSGVSLAVLMCKNPHLPVPQVQAHKTEHSRDEKGLLRSRILTH